MDYTLEDGQLVIVNKIVYKITKITNDSVELVGYRNRTKLKIGIDSLQKAPIELIDACHMVDIKYKNSLKKYRNKTKKYYKY